MGGLMEWAGTLRTNLQGEGKSHSWFHHDWSRRAASAKASTGFYTLKYVAEETVDILGKVGNALVSRWLIDGLALMYLKSIGWEEFEKG